jgi:hypothetical protein
MIQKLYLNNGVNFTLFDLQYSSTLAQPLLLDFYGNFSMSLLGQRKGSHGFSLWSFGNDSAFVRDLGDQFHDCKLSEFHSNAWVDLNGDCKAGTIRFFLI